MAVSPTGVLRYSELPLYPPYWKNQLLMLPLNRSIVLGPREVKGINLPLRFPPAALQHIFVALPARAVDFVFKTDGCRIWGVLHNLTSTPQHLSPRFDLIACRTSIQQYSTPDCGSLPVPSTRQGMLRSPPRTQFAGATSTPLVPPWLLAFRQQFPSLFQPGLGRCRTHQVSSFPFKFPLPLKQQSRPVISGPAEDRAVLTEILKLVQLGAVREVSQEPYVIPAFGVPKKTGSVRLVLDFRKFNSCVQHQPFLPVNRDFSLAGLRPYKIGSSLDLANAYLQVPLHPSLWRYLGVSAGGRFFQYTRLPFGYHNSPHEFLRALWPTMRRIQRRVRSQVVYYMDDILLLSPSLQVHQQDLRILFLELQKDGWRLNWDKCRFAQERFDYLGVTLTPRGMQPSVPVLQQFQQAPMPRTQKGWRQLAGWVNHSLRFLWHGHHTLDLLQQVKRSPTPLLWRRFLSTLQASFVRCSLPTPLCSYTVITDASKVGWGALLLQGSNIIRCAAGLWSSSFQHHTSNTLELEALCRACTTFRPWIFGASVHCVMDNQAAVSLNNPANLSPFLKRRLEALQWLCPSISFSPGPFNYLADFLSRQSLWLSSCAVEDDYEIGRDVLVTPVQWEQAHEGHFGTLKTFLRLRDMGLHPPFGWVREKIRECIPCQRFHRPQPTTEFGEWQEARKPGQVIGIDFMGPFPERKVGKRKFVLVVVDRLTGVSGAWAFRGAGSREIIRGLEWWVRSRGCPQVLCADVAQATRSRELKNWCKDRGVRQEFSPPYHHSSIGFVERFNQTLLNRLRRMWVEDPKAFAEKVERAVRVYNETPRSGTIDSPEQLWKGPEGTWEFLLNKQREERRRANWRNRYRRVKGNLNLGQRVWVWNTMTVTLRDKLESWWEGPGVLVGRISGSVWRVRGPDGKVWVRHADMLRPYRG